MGCVGIWNGGLETLGSRKVREEFKERYRKVMGLGTGCGGLEQEAEEVLP